MGKRIPLDVNPVREVAIDGAAVARALGLEVEAFRHLMEVRRITLLCEQGTGEDAGLYRATFYHEGRRARFVVDGEGRILAPPDT